MLRRPKLSPEATQKVNFAADVLILVGACFIASTESRMVHWKVALAMSAIAALAWWCWSRVLRHYDVYNGRGFLGDLALTLVLFAGVAMPLTLLRYVVPRYAMTTEITRFLAVMLPAVLWVRLRATGLRLWRNRPIDQLLIVGVGPLGRLTHREIRDGQKRRQISGYLR